MFDSLLPTITGL
ncbi:G-ACD-00350 [African swine fever virus]|nr:G-ACD-00350 [African swine fever virus]